MNLLLDQEFLRLFNDFRKGQEEGLRNEAGWKKFEQENFVPFLNFIEKQKTNIDLDAQNQAKVIMGIIDKANSEVRAEDGMLGTYSQFFKNCEVIAIEVDKQIKQEQQEVLREESAKKIQAVWRGTQVRQEHTIPPTSDRSKNYARVYKQDQALEEIEKANSGDEEYILEPGYYEKDDLSNNHRMFNYDNGSSNVKEIKGLRWEANNKTNKTVLVTDNGFTLFEYDDKLGGLGSSFKAFQEHLGNECGFEYKNIEDFEEKRREREEGEEERGEFSSLSFFRVKKYEGEYSDLGKGLDENFKYGYAISSDDSVETCYLSTSGWKEVENEYNKQYQGLLDFRREFNGFLSYYKSLDTDKKSDLNKKLEDFYAQESVQDSDGEKIQGMGSFAKYINKLVKGLSSNNGKESLEELQQAKMMFDDFLSENDEISKAVKEEITTKTIKVDDYFAQHVKAPLNNQFNNKILSSSNKEISNGREVTLSVAERENMIGLFKRNYTQKNRETENLNAFLDIEVPAALYDGIHVKRQKISSRNLNNWVGNKTVDTEFATVVFKGESDDNIMYLTLKGTDYHVKVRRDPETQAVTIDSDNLYKRDIYGKWNANELSNVDSKSKKEFNNFGVLAIADVNGVRNAAICHNGKSQSYQLESTLSHDLSGNLIDSHIIGQNIDAHSLKSSIGISEVIDEDASVASDAGDEFDEAASVASDEGSEIRVSSSIRKVGKIIDAVNEQLGGCPPDLDGIDNNFSYVISGKLYKHSNDDEEIGYKITKINIEEGENEYDSMDFYISKPEYDILRTNLDELRILLDSKKITDDIYNDCKSFIFNKLNDNITGRIKEIDSLGEEEKVEKIKEFLGIEGNSSIYESSTNYPRVIVDSREVRLMGIPVLSDHVRRGLFYRNREEYDKTRRSEEGLPDQLKKIDLREIEINLQEGIVRGGENEKSFIERMRDSIGIGDDNRGYINRIDKNTRSDNTRGGSGPAL